MHFPPPSRLTMPFCPCYDNAKVLNGEVTRKGAKRGLARAVSRPAAERAKDAPGAAGGEIPGRVPPLTGDERSCALPPKGTRAQLGWYRGFSVPQG